MSASLLPRSVTTAVARNLAAAGFCVQRGVPFVADFSLNAVNELTVDYLLALGARRVTAALDLGRRVAHQAAPEFWLRQGLVI